MDIEGYITQISKLENEYNSSLSKKVYGILQKTIFEFATKYKIEKLQLEHYFQLLKSKSSKLKLSRLIRKPKIQYTLENPRYEKKIIGVADIESGTLIIGDYINTKFEEHLTSDEFSKMIDKLHKGNNIVALGIGGDGAIGIELRILDSESPSISKKEANICRAVSEEYFLNITDSKLIYGDLGSSVEDETRKIVAEIRPGKYRLRFFILEIINKFTKYVVVLSPSDYLKPNISIETLE